MIEVFGQAADGSKVQRVTIEQDGLRAAVITQGAALQNLQLAGCAFSLVLGYQELQPYLHDPNYFGAIVGRFANRINNGAAQIAGRHYQLDRNTPYGHTLHGGREGTRALNWRVVGHTPTEVRLETRLADGHMGFPGNLDAQVAYRVLPEQMLEVDIVAHTDAPTLCSFAHHSYFNLDGTPTISGHQLRVHADTYLPVDLGGIPSGQRVHVTGTEIDFRAVRALGDGHILDHNFCLADQRRDLTPAAQLRGGGPDGITLSVATTEPGLQIYTGQGIDPRGALGLNGALYGSGAGIALEPQLWPDAPNHPDFPSALLHPGETYRQISRFGFAK